MSSTRASPWHAGSTPPLKRAEETARFLSAVKLGLTCTLDYRETLGRVAELAVAALAYWCVVDVCWISGIIGAGSYTAIFQPRTI